MPLPPILETAPDNHHTPISPDSIDIQGIDTEFIKRLDTALEANTTFKEQVYMTLQGVNMLLVSFNNLKGIYADTANSINTTKAQLQTQALDLKAKYEHLHSHTLKLNQYRQDFSSTLRKNAQIITTNVATSKKYYDSIQAIYLQTNSKLQDVLVYKEIIKSTLEKLQTLQSQKIEIIKIAHDIDTKLQEATTLRDSLLNRLDLKFDDIKLGLKSHTLDLGAQLSQAKDNNILEIQQVEAKAQENIGVLVTQIENKLQEFELSFTDKQANLELSNRTLTNTRNELIAEKQSFTTQLSQAKDNHLLTISQQVESHKQHLNDKTHEHSQFLQQLRDNYKQELDSTAAAEIGLIKKYIQQIQATTTQFGSNFTRVTYTQNATFTPPADGIYYYVFLQGGKGADNSNTPGGITSFGNYLSASGGAGSPHGVGLQGACVAGFVEPANTNPINITVGGGGIVIISYTQKEAK